MKKILAASVGALLLTGSLVATSGSAAQADPYPGTIATSTSVTASPAKVKLRKKVTVCASVTASGNVAPSGTISFTVSRGSKVYLTSTQAYSGTSVCVKTKKLKKKGRYTASAAFTAPANSVFKASSGSTTFKVKKKKRR